MRFETALVFGIISFCLGGISGSLICVTAGKVFHKKVLKTHFTVICILLSLAVAAGSAGFVLIKDFSPELSKALEAVPFFLVLAAAGFLCTLFAKIAVPLFLIFYITLSVLTGVPLYSRFGSQTDSVCVTLNKTSVNAGNKSFAVDSPSNKELVVEVYTLPGRLLLPLPRVWYSVIGTVDSSHPADNTEDIRAAASFSGDAPLEEKADSPFFWGRKYKAYKNWCLKDRVYLRIALPQDGVLPSVYTLKFITSGENFKCLMEKNL